MALQVGHQHQIVRSPLISPPNPRHCVKNSLPPFLREKVNGRGVIKTCPPSISWRLSAYLAQRLQQGWVLSGCARTPLAARR